MTAFNKEKELKEEQKRRRANDAATEIVGLSREQATKEHFSGDDYSFVMFYANKQHMTEIDKWIEKTFPEVPDLLTQLFDAFIAKNDGLGLFEEVRQLPAPALIRFHSMLTEKRFGEQFRSFVTWLNPHIVQSILNVFGTKTGAPGPFPLSTGDESGLKWSTTRGNKLPEIRRIEE